MADSLQKFNLKKASVQKALDNLADSGRISFKEYGKQKIYIARQDQFDIPNSEELSRMKEENAKLQKQLEDQKRAIAEVEGGILPNTFFFFHGSDIILVAVGWIIRECKFFKHKHSLDFLNYERKSCESIYAIKFPSFCWRIILEKGLSDCIGQKHIFIRFIFSFLCVCFSLPFNVTNHPT